MKKRSAIVAVTTAVIAAAITFGNTTFAHAADQSLSVYSGRYKAGTIKHIDDGDYFRVYDNLKDGHGVRGSVGGDGDFVSRYNGNGAGSYVSFQRNILSGKEYYILICIVDGPDDEVGPCAKRYIRE